MGQRRRLPAQLTLDEAIKPSGRGGKRPGAGRPRGRKTVSHDARPAFAPRFPQHVTWRLVGGVRSLRRGYLIESIRTSIRAAQKPSFRIVEFSIQSNHVHLVTEAASKKALARGMQGLARRLAPPINRKLRRSGKLFATRYHARVLKTPREVRNALRYVLLNARHHASGARTDRSWVDPFSSGPWFRGWSGRFYGESRELARTPKPTSDATTWLLTTGWQRWGAIRTDEM